MRLQTVVEFEFFWERIEDRIGKDNVLGPELERKRLDLRKVSLVHAALVNQCVKEDKRRQRTNE